MSVFATCMYVYQVPIGTEARRHWIPGTRVKDGYEWLLTAGPSLQHPTNTVLVFCTLLLLRLYFISCWELYYLEIRLKNKQKKTFKKIWTLVSLSFSTLISWNWAEAVKHLGTSTWSPPPASWAQGVQLLFMFVLGFGFWFFQHFKCGACALEVSSEWKAETKPKTNWKKWLSKKLLGIQLMAEPEWEFGWGLRWTEQAVSTTWLRNAAPSIQASSSDNPETQITSLCLWKFHFTKPSKQTCSVSSQAAHDKLSELEA